MRRNIIRLFLPAATKLGQGNIFTGVCLSTGGSASVHAGIYPRWEHPPGQTPPPWYQTRPGPDLPGGDPPGTRPSREADSSIRSTSGRYASYWNAFLFMQKNSMKKNRKINVEFSFRTAANSQVIAV